MQTVGYYPQSDASGNPVTGMSGTLRVDDAGKREECKIIKTSTSQDKKMAQAIKNVAANPGTYTLRGTNCVNFVRDVLNAGGIQTFGTPWPRLYYPLLPGQGPDR